jgi:hypothetical protein
MFLLLNAFCWFSVPSAQFFRSGCHWLGLGSWQETFGFTPT